MKKVNNLINILICTSMMLWVIRAVLSYINYTRHITLFATNGWFWYDDVLNWGKFIIPIVVVCVVVKLVICKKTKN